MSNHPATASATAAAIATHVNRAHTLNEWGGIDFTADDRAVRVTVYDDATVRIVVSTGPSPRPRVDFANTDARIIASTVRALLNA